MRFVPLLLLTGCGLTSSGPDAETLTRDCIQSIDTGATLSNGPLTMNLTTGCAGPSRLDSVQRIRGTLESVRSFGDGGDHYSALRFGQFDGWGTIDIIGLLDSAPAYAVWMGETMPMRMRVDYARPFDDLAVADLDHDGHGDVIAAGDNAIRVSLGTGMLQVSPIAATAEHELLTGKPFRTVAVSPKGELYYLAQDASGMELGVARASVTDPLAFTATTLATDAPGATRSLAIADVDGDGLPDAIGFGARVFVYSSLTNATHFLDEGALAIGAGDIDADGVREPIFLAADGESVRRVEFAPDGSLASQHVLDVHAQAMAVGDFDANGIDDIATVDRLRRAGSTISLYRY